MVLGINANISKVDTDIAKMLDDLKTSLKGDEKLNLSTPAKSDTDIAEMMRSALTTKGDK